MTTEPQIDYLDTGSRDPSQALGHWLSSFAAEEIEAIRIQSGFFSAGALGYLAPLAQSVQRHNGKARIVVGSNEGITRRGDLEVLLDLIQPSENRQIAVVAFRQGFYHPKVIHLRKKDGAQAAYVGSANFGADGVASLHIEAGVVIEAGAGSSPDVLRKIVAGVDGWFEEEREGLWKLRSGDDLDRLVELGVIGVPRGPSPTSPERAASTESGALPRLSRLLTPPPIYGTKFRTAEWTKKLSASDAQRKEKGNQRGSITLVAAGQPVNTQTYFRYELFADADWHTVDSAGGKQHEEAQIPFDVTFLGNRLGEVQLTVSYDADREAEQDNYTTLLHLGALAPAFQETDVTRRRLTITRGSPRRYELVVE